MIYFTWLLDNFGCAIEKILQDLVQEARNSGAASESLEPVLHILEQKPVSFLEEKLLAKLMEHSETTDDIAMIVQILTSCLLRCGDPVLGDLIATNLTPCLLIKDQTFYTLQDFLGFFEAVRKETHEIGSHLCSCLSLG